MQAVYCWHPWPQTPWSGYLLNPRYTWLVCAQELGTPLAHKAVFTTSWVDRQTCTMSPSTRTNTSTWNLSTTNSWCLIHSIFLDMYPSMYGCTDEYIHAYMHTTHMKQACDGLQPWMQTQNTNIHTHSHAPSVSKLRLVRAFMQTLCVDISMHLLASFR